MGAYADRRSFFEILPEPVLGKASTKHTDRGFPVTGHIDVTVVGAHGKRNRMIDSIHAVHAVLYGPDKGQPPGQRISLEPGDRVRTGSSDV